MTNAITTSYGNYLRNVGDLPAHITHSQYLQLREMPKKRYSEVELRNKRNDFLIRRDTLLIDMCWETGGRIGDVTSIEIRQDIDFTEKVLKLNIKKSRKLIKINLTDTMCYEIMQFMNKYPQKEPFKMTSANAWYILKKYGEMMGIKIHPHMMRHGLALFLLAKRVPIAIISYRLGHANTKVTMDNYMKVTPDIEKQFMQEIEFR